MTKAACIAALLALASCSYFTPDAAPAAIARVNEEYLYKEDVANLVPDGASKEDSLLLVNSYIDKWATQKLLIDAAEVNLNDDKKAEFEQLISQYKNDLYTKAYIEEIVKRSVDTAVSDSEIEHYYKDNKNNFKTNGLLVRLRYIHLDRDNPKFATIKSKFLDFRKSDRKFWEANVLQFKNFAFNDTVWVAMNQVYSKLPFINPDNRSTYISPGKATQFDAGASTYLLKVTNVLDRNQTSPYEYIKPTLREIIVNKRKLELIKKFEKEITDDAIKNKKYEIYK
jgi:hypothetical protein